MSLFAFASAVVVYAAYQLTRPKNEEQDEEEEEEMVIGTPRANKKDLDKDWVVMEHDMEEYDQLRQYVLILL